MAERAKKGPGNDRIAGMSPRKPMDEDLSAKAGD